MSAPIEYCVTISDHLYDVIVSLIEAECTDAEIIATGHGAITPATIALARRRMQRDGWRPPADGICRSCTRREPLGFDRVGNRPWVSRTLCGDCAAGVVR